ncbi:MAG TPA: alanine racemase [Chloroflexaceae bacterium]|nr:alanine racemase [Chloroflexaceae bacterium]
MTHHHADLLGRRRDELATPALLADLPALEANERRMAAALRGSGAALRPHAKAHRSPELARRQLAAGAAGICCAGLPEAEAMLAAGVADILIPRQLVRPAELARAARLAAAARLTLVVDDEDVLDRLDRAALDAGVRVPVLVDVDLRLGRAGVPPGEPARRLAHAVARRPGVELHGLMGYEGSMHQLGAEERERECRRALTALVATRERIEADGLPLPVVSAGATSTYRLAAGFPGGSEVQPGAYLLGDGRYRRTTGEFACALSVLATVVSRPSPGRVTIDAGQKKLSADAGLPEAADPGLRLVALNEEHGLLAWEGEGRGPRVGDTVTITPAHGGTTVNLYDRIYAMRDGRVAEVWSVIARGA